MLCTYVFKVKSNKMNLHVLFSTRYDCSNSIYLQNLMESGFSVLV